MIVKIPLLYPFTQPYPVGVVTELTPPASRPMAQGAPWWTMSWTPGPAPRYLTAPRLWTQLDVLPNNCDKRNGPQQSPVLEGLWRPPNGRSRYGFLAFEFAKIEGETALCTGDSVIHLKPNWLPWAHSSATMSQIRRIWSWNQWLSGACFCWMWGCRTW